MQPFKQALNQNSYKYLSGKIFLLVVSVFVFSVSALAELTPYQASYYATFDRFSGRATMKLVQNPDTGLYTYSSVTKPKGIAALMGKIREWSVFSLNGTKVIPETYTHKSRDKQNISYDWSTKKAHSSADGEKAVLDLTGNELDLLSLQMQLMSDLQIGELKKSYSIITDNKIKTYVISPLEEETLDIAGKTYRTQKLKQQRKGSSRHNFIWMATDLDYALVKMQQYKGEKLRGTLTMTNYKQN